MIHADVETEKVLFGGFVIVETWLRNFLCIVNQDAKTGVL